MVAQEDGDAGGGGGEKSWSSTKKGKPNKVPQRGLGIAALEKLRREENQRRLAAAGADVAGGSSSENSAAGVIFHSLPPRACYIGNYALFRPPLDCGDGSAPFVWSSIQSDGPSNPHSRLPLLPRRQPPPEHQQQQTYSLVMKNSLSSPPPSSGAGLQMEPPSNQSYVSVNPSSSCQQEQRLIAVKRPWPFDPDSSRAPVISTSQARLNHVSAMAHGSAPKRSASWRSGKEEGMAIDGKFLSLGSSSVAPPSQGKVKQAIHQRSDLSSQPSRVLESTEQAGGSMKMVFYNLMDLPDHVMEEQWAAVEDAGEWGGQPTALMEFMDLPQHLHGVLLPEDAEKMCNINPRTMDSRKIT